MTEKSLSSNLLPHNPLSAAGVFEELKRLKGDKAWVQFELELLCAQYPDNNTFTQALDKVTAKAKIEPIFNTATEAKSSKKNKSVKKAQ